MFSYASSHRLGHTLFLTAIFFSLNSYRKRWGAPNNRLHRNAICGKRWHHQDVTDVWLFMRSKNKSTHEGITSIYLQTVVDHFTGPFNEFKCLGKQASYLLLNIFYYMFYFYFRYDKMKPGRLISMNFLWNQVEIAMNSEISILD